MVEIHEEVHEAAVAALRAHFGAYNIGRSLAGRVAEVVLSAVAPLLVQAGREAAAADVNAMDADDIGDLIQRVRAVAVARGWKVGDRDGA